MDDKQTKGHPLPASDEARGYLIPERLQREKGLGDDAPGDDAPGDDAPGEDGGEDPRGSDKDKVSPQSSGRKRSGR